MLERLVSARSLSLSTLHNWVFGVVVLLLLIILGLLLFFPMPRIGLGDEIKGFPVKETSLASGTGQPHSP
jgi:K+-transporting ATPase A subunit